MPFDAAAVVALVTCHEEPPSAELLDAVAEHVGSVLVVADGLPEHAAAELELLADARGVDVVRLASRNGKGSAVAVGIRHGRGFEAVLVVDGDGQHPPEAIPRFLDASERADLVIGDRFSDIGRIPLLRRIGNVVAAAVVACTARRRVRDTQCGMRLLRGRALEIEFPAGGYESETVHLKRCLAAGVRTAWVPIPAIYAGEPSSFRSLRDSLRVLRAALAASDSGGSRTGDPRGAGCVRPDATGTMGT